MPKAKALLLLIAMLAVGASLAACGGDDGDEDAGSTATTPTEATAPAPGEQSGGGEEKGGKPPGDSDSSTGSGAGGERDTTSAGDEKPASLATDPGSIRNARVTETGAVQTLPPSEPAQAEAMENSYGSIRAFGEESEGEEATDITFALLQYLNAKATGDWATACARIYSVLRANLEKGGRSCAEVYGGLMGRVSAASRAEQATIDVASVRRGEDNRAFVIYKTPGTLSADMPMYLEGDVWTVGALEAYALTPEQLGAGE